MALLLYPQFVLAFWAPLVVLGLWRVTSGWHRHLTPRTRFWLAWGVTTFPLLSLFVPYLPNLPFREALPYRVPVAWGVLNSPDITQVPFWVTLAAHLPFLLIVLGFLGALARGVLEEAAALLHVSRVPSRLEKTRVGLVRVLHMPGEVAFTLGVFRPQIYLSEAVWAGAHCSAVLAHERAHRPGAASAAAGRGAALGAGVVVSSARLGRAARVRAPPPNSAPTKPRCARRAARPWLEPCSTHYHKGRSFKSKSVFMHRPPRLRLVKPKRACSWRVLTPCRTNLERCPLSPH